MEALGVGYFEDNDFCIHFRGANLPILPTSQSSIFFRVQPPLLRRVSVRAATGSKHGLCHTGCDVPVAFPEQVPPVLIPRSENHATRPNSLAPVMLSED